MNKILEKLINADGSWNNDHSDKLIMWQGRYIKELYIGLDDENPLIREGCAEIIGNIGFLESVPILIAHSDDPDKHVRWDIINSIEMILAFQPGAITEWTRCNIKNRHKLKKRLIEFWKNNQDYLLIGTSRDSFTHAGGEAYYLWDKKYGREKSGTDDL